MNQWEQLRFKRAKLRLFFWAAKQALLLAVLWIVAAVLIVEAVSDGSVSALHHLLVLVDR